MMRGRGPRHARPSGRGAMAAAYDDLRAELTTVRSARWDDQLEIVRLTALTEELAGQVAGLQDELASVRSALELARSTPPLVVREPYPVPAPYPGFAAPAYQAAPMPSQQPSAPMPTAMPAAPPAAPVTAPAAAVREDLLLSEMAEMRRLVAHQQQLLADLTVRLLDLLARFLPAAPAAPLSYAAPAAPPAVAPPSYAPPPAAGAPPAQPAPPRFAPAPTPAPAPEVVMDDETATRLRVIREAFGR